VFDPLAITLVIATNHAFKNAYPKNRIHNKPINNIPDHRNPPSPPKKKMESKVEELKNEPPSTQQTKYQQEIDKINKSSYSAKKRKQMIKNLDSKTY
jgi:hypothetical protein